MTHEEFLQSPPIARLLERAALSAGTPLCVHHVTRNQEGDRVCGWGQCGACRAVSETPGGKTACRLSRLTASTMAVRQRRPISYLCHMGFACVAVTPFDDEGYVITLGPFCPMEEQRSLADDVLAGFAALRDEPVDELPYSLDDIHRAPAAAVPAVASWLRECIGESWAAQMSPDGDELKGGGAGDEAAETPMRSRTQGTPADRFVTLAREIAAALTAGSHARARSLLQGHLEELERGGVQDEGVRRARVAALTAATIEALGRAGISLAPAWPNHEAFVRQLPTLAGDGALLDGAIGVFSFLRRKAVREEQASRLPDYPELHAIVAARLLDGVTLEYVAEALGQTPSAVSHRLKRKFGMSFSEYVGRIRIDMAKQLFRRTELNATEIARRIGIADQSNFTKLFKKIEGLSPSAYRKAHGKGS